MRGEAGGSRASADRVVAVVVISASWTYASILYRHQNGRVLLGRPNQQSSWPVGGRRRSRPILVRTDGHGRPPGGREYARTWLARFGRLPSLTPSSFRGSRRPLLRSPGERPPGKGERLAAPSSARFFLGFGRGSLRPARPLFVFDPTAGPGRPVLAVAPTTRSRR